MGSQWLRYVVIIICPLYAHADRHKQIFSFARRPGGYVHGTRVVCPVLQPYGESRVKVLDFNVHALRADDGGEARCDAFGHRP